MLDLNNKKTDSLANDPRERILKAAGEEFARSGYRHATVREICKKAGVNVAAVNYYFGDKEKLYLDTLRYWRKIALQRHPLNAVWDENFSYDERLGFFIRTFLVWVFEEGEAARFGKLVAREYIEPTGALDILVEETIRPTYRLLASIVEGILGGQPSESCVRSCCASVISQCLFMLYARPVVERVFPDLHFSSEEIDAMADHIVNFPLSALKNLTVEQRKREESELP